MKAIVSFLLIALSQSVYAQIDLFERKAFVMDTQDYIDYYPFIEGVQMIKIDHQKLFEHKARASDPWGSFAMSSAPPSYYFIMQHPFENPTYILRDTNGIILNCYPSREYRGQYKLMDMDSVTTTSHLKPGNTYPHYRGNYKNYKPAWGCCIRNVYGKFGLMDTFGQVRVQPQYDSILVRNGVYLVRKGDFWGLLDSDYKEVFEPQFTSLVPIHRDFFIAEKKGCFGIVEPGGKQMAEIEYHEIKFMKGAPDLYSFQIKGLMGIMDSAFNIIQPAQYQHVQRMGGVYRVLDSKSQKYGVLNGDGTVLLPAIYTDIHLLGSYNFRVRKYNQDSGVNKYGLFDRFGANILPVEYDEITWVRHKAYFAVRKGTEQFIIGQNGKIINE